VHHIITIGSPHHGTWLARFSHLTNGREMRRQGFWLQLLQRDEATRTLPPFTCWYSNCDNIVFPPSTAMLLGAENRLLTGAAHVDLAFRTEVMQASLALVTS
jgi:triacylglycerol lipase